MRLFFNTRNKRAEERSSLKEIDSSVLACVMDFAKKLEPLKRPASLCVKLVGSPSSRNHGHAAAGMSYYLLIFSEGEEHGYLNAGYAAGQISSYLHFLGISACVLRNPDAWMHLHGEGGKKCAVAVEFGKALQKGKDRETKEAAERPCISKEYREEWAEEVLELTRKSFPMQAGHVRVLCRNNCICFMTKTISGRKSAICELEAGIAAANVMSAAEELWIDLTPVDIGDPRCLISLCRRKDRAEVIKKSRNAFLENPGKPALEAAGRLN